MLASLRAQWDEVRSSTPSHLRVRLVLIGGAVLTLVSLVVAGAGGVASWVGFVVLAALAAYQPAGIAPLLAIAYAIGAWWAGVPGPWHWALLPAALGVLVVHAAATLAASVPPAATIPVSVRRRYTGQAGVVAVVTTLAWLGAALITGVVSSGSGAWPGVIGLTVLATALVLMVRRQALSR